MSRFHTRPTVVRLFVGALPARQPDAYYALLPVRVPKMTKVCKLEIPLPG